LETLKGLSWFKKHSLSQQLLVNSGLSLLTVGLGTLLINYQLIQSDLDKQIRTRAQSITQSIEFATEGLLEVEQRHILRRVVQNYATLPTVVEIAIVSPDGQVLADSKGSKQELSYGVEYTELLSAINEAASTGTEVSREITFHQKSVLVYILPFNSLLFGTSGRRGLAIAIIDLRQMQQEVGKTFLTSTITMLVGIAIILLLIWWLIRKQLLAPLDSLNEAVLLSKETATFSMPEKISAKEIQFLANTFQSVFTQLEAYEKLKAEIIQRLKVEAVLRESEARERSKSEQLEKTLLELQRTQTQLVQNEKMSSLGQLVAGVAHEINNPVNFIYGNIQYLEGYIQDLIKLIHLYQNQQPNGDKAVDLLLEDIDLDYIEHDLPKLLNSMKIGSQRIREIVLSLRTFSRMDEAEFKAVDIHEGMESTLLILQHRLKEQPNRPAIKVIKDYGQLPLLECYAGQLNQVFMNILANAIDAVEERMTKEPFEPTITIHTSLIDSNYVKIAIADNGVGIPEAVQKQIFNPFFTTKPIGKGTGMGMSISYQIITDRHGGELDCISTHGKGTEFVIKIPIRQSYTQGLNSAIRIQESDCRRITLV
jgi:two-component system NtrC family sensor kinase